MRQLHTLGDAINLGVDLVAVCRSVTCRRRVKVDVAALAYVIGEGQPLLPEKGKRHFSEKMRCSECRHVGAIIWPEDAKGPEGMLGGLSYAVHEWYSHHNQPHKTVARISNVIVAHATYAAARTEYPGRHLTLQQGAFVLEDSRFTVVRGGKAG